MQTCPTSLCAGSTETDGIELRRRGLEKFLHRIAIHPLLGSTKLFQDFLTIKDDKVRAFLSSLPTRQKCSIAMVDFVSSALGVWTVISNLNIGTDKYQVFD